MDPRIHIIRMVMAMLASLVLLWLSPWWSWVVPVALMMSPAVVTACGKCTAGSCHATVQAVFAGIVDGSCGDCENFNATWEVTGSCVTAGVSCTWHYDLPSSICIYDDIDITLVPGIPATDIGLSVSISDALGGDFPMVWFNLENSTGSEVDCAFSAHAVAFSSDGSTCDASASTCTLTAL